MKKILIPFFAAAMILSTVFIGQAISNDSSFSAAAQTVTVRKKRKPGIARSTYRGGRWVVRKTWDGTKYVSRKVWVGTKYGARKTVQGTKWTAHKTKRGAKKVISRTKKVVY